MSGERDNKVIGSISAYITENPTAPDVVAFLKAMDDLTTHVDIVDRLRADGGHPDLAHPLCLEAANEIDRLRRDVSTLLAHLATTDFEWGGGTT